MDEAKRYYRRHLPHIQPEEAYYHVVFRLAGSIPVETMLELRREREIRRLEDGEEGEQQRKQYQEWYFEWFDSLLDGNSAGPLWLRKPEVAVLVKEALYYRDGKEYELLAYCIMPNHVHMAIELVGLNDIPTYRAKPLYRILQSWKRHTARECNESRIQEKRKGRGTQAGKQGAFREHYGVVNIARSRSFFIVETAVQRVSSTIHITTLQSG